MALNPFAGTLPSRLKASYEPPRANQSRAKPQAPAFRQTTLSYKSENVPTVHAAVTASKKRPVSNAGSPADPAAAPHSPPAKRRATDSTMRETASLEAAFSDADTWTAFEAVAEAVDLQLQQGQHVEQLIQPSAAALESVCVNASAVPELHTGGAAGTDAQFETLALKNDHAVVVHSFSGHRPQVDSTQYAVPGQRRVNILTNGRLALLDSIVQSAARKLERNVPGVGDGDFVRGLLRRNADLALSVESIYAVADFASNSTTSHGVNIDGGTAWACQVFADKARVVVKDGGINLFLFSQREGKWWRYHKRGYGGGGWQPIALADVPRPSGRYGGIGTRKLTAAGSAAIKTIFL